MLRAIAVATDTSDVVGTVDLSCEEDGLRVHFVRASAYASEYMPTVPVRGQRMLVPYEAIREAHDDGETLRLTLAAPRVPHRRLVLAHFTRDLRDDAGRVHQRRRRAQAAVAAGCAGAAGLLAVVAQQLGAFSSAALSMVGAFGAVFGGVWAAQEAGRRVMIGGVEEGAERRAFFHELSRRLARTQSSALVIDGAATEQGPATSGATIGAPGRAAIRGPGPSPESERSPLAELYPILGAVGVAAAVSLVAVSMGRSVVGPETGAATTASAPAVALSASGVAPAEAAPREEPLGLCMCQGPSSPHLPARVPRLSILPRVERARTDPQRPSMTVEVAVVNNGAEPLREVKGNVEFLLPGAAPGAPPRVRSDRGFYYEGPLNGGHAVKWHLTGRGTSFRVLHNHDDSLDDSALAPADAFAELLQARTRSVRVHGAMMLTRMRDERAPAAIERLREGAPEGDQPLLQALARAAAPVYACEIEQAVEDGRLSLSACVMNTSEEEVGPLDAIALVTPRATSEDGPLTTSSVLRGRILIPPRTGVRVQGSMVSPEATSVVEIQVQPAR